MSRASFPFTFRPADRRVGTRRRLTRGAPVGTRPARRLSAPALLPAASLLLPARCTFVASMPNYVQKIVSRQEKLFKSWGCATNMLRYIRSVGQLVVAAFAVCRALPPGNVRYGSRSPRPHSRSHRPAVGGGHQLHACGFGDQSIARDSDRYLQEDQVRDGRRGAGRLKILVLKVVFLFIAFIFLLNYINMYVFMSYGAFR